MPYHPLNILYADFPGGEADLQFLLDDAWLQDAAVNTYITEQKGRWQVAIVLAWVHFPMRMICRYLQDYATQAKAQMSAELFCRTAQKDERGTLQIQWNDWDICTN